MSSFPSTLQANGDFLTLTRQNPDSMVSFDFEVSHLQSDAKTKVSVLDTGIILFEPVGRETSKDIVLSCGVHGNETAPIEICADLVKAIILGGHELNERVLFLFGNPWAMNIDQRFEEENMNRLFSGAHSEPALDNKERVRAKLLEDSVTEFFEKGAKINSEREKLHYDLHTAIRASKQEKFAVYPFLHGKPWSKAQLQFLLACGVDTVLLSQSPTTTFSYYSSNVHGAHAFTVELGKVRPFGQNDMTKFEEVKETLSRLIAAQDLSLKVYNKEDFNIFTISQIINRTKEDFSLNFDDDTPNFTDFPVGYEIANDGGEPYTIKDTGEAIIFPNAKVALGQRALLTVIPTEI